MYRIGDGDADSNSTYVSYVLLLLRNMLSKSRGVSVSERTFGVCSLMIRTRESDGFCSRDSISHEFCRRRIRTLAVHVECGGDVLYLLRYPELFRVLLKHSLSMVRGWKDV